MKRVTLTVLALVASLLVAHCGAGDSKFGGDTDTDGTGGADKDGDGITDTDEGRYSEPGGTDTDGDTVPDYEDDDSDGDGIGDATEAGDLDSSTPPVDSDADGTPDFRDWDSDDNGIVDQDEGAMDSDGDGVGNYADDDNDGDTLSDELEIGGDPSFPIDADGDGVPDYLDLDSDNDTITDMHERPAETDIDEDLIPDRHDLDTDGDTIPDATEAGDTNPETPPVDTDLDGLPDFRDTDSDNDGLSDQWENENMLDPYNEDTDLDGIPDLIEVGAGTDPLDAGSNPTTEGNFYFLVPYMEEPDPPEDTLVFSTDLQKADVFFLMDTTGSMGGAISNLKSTLSSLIIPETDLIIPDVWFGVGHFDDYPVSPYGSSGTDDVFALNQRMTGVVADAQAGVDSLTLHSGSDGEESHVPALWATATGGDLGTYLPAQTACDPTEFGYPCFRADSIPIVVLISDAPFHNGPGGTAAYSGISPTPPTYDDAVAALLSVHAKVISIVSGGWGEALANHTLVSTDTGAVDITGTPLVYETDYSGSGLGLEVVNGIETMAHQVPIDVSARDRDDETDLVDATQFIESIVPNPAGGVTDPTDPSLVCVSGLPVNDIDGDTLMDEFVGVLPGTTVCFDIDVRMNETIEATEEPQVYMAYIDVLGDGITVLDTREVFFMIPPDFEGGGPD